MKSTSARGAGLRVGLFTLAGIALLVAGVLWALRVRPEPPVAHAA